MPVCHSADRVTWGRMLTDDFDIESDSFPQVGRATDSIGVFAHGIQ